MIIVTFCGLHLFSENTRVAGWNYYQCDEFYIFIDFQPKLMSLSSTQLFSEMEQQPQNGLQHELSSTPTRRMPREKKEEESTLMEKKHPYPKAVFFIIGNEFCERFCYFGMKAILVLYFMDHLSWSNSTATGVYHTFIVGCCFTSILGAVLADGYIGKYRTILYLSMVYIIGSSLMSFTSFPPPFWLGPVIGLILIALGTGGIKPCVSAFGGDQFKKDQERERASFFSSFYFSINLGSFFSIVLTPLIKDGVDCFNKKCFPLAFGVPALLMIVSTGLFVLGHKWYVVKPPTGSVITGLFKCIGSALKNKCKSGSGHKQHWLDHAGPEFQMSFLEDVKRVLKVMILYIPVPVFWALFDQQGSRWTIQSTQLDRTISDNWFFLPEQMQAVNPILILIFIPLFDMGIYPLMDRLKIPNMPLHRMVVGMILASLSFVAAGILQLKIDSTLPRLENGKSFVALVNESPCDLRIGGSVPDILVPRHLLSSRMTLQSGTHEFDVHPSSNSCFVDVHRMFNLTFWHPDSYLVVFSASDPQSPGLTTLGPQGRVTTSSNISSDREPVLRADAFSYDLNKEPTGECYLRMLLVGSDRNISKAVLLRQGSQKRYSFKMNAYAQKEYKQIGPGRYNVIVQGTYSLSIKLSNGGKYTLLIDSGSSDTDMSHLLVEDLEPNVISIWFQLPQYVIITLGEVAFSITGLWFAYSQAPPTMKSVVQASWFLTTGFGNIIDVIIGTFALIPSQAIEFFFFAILMFVTMIIFAVLSSYYQYYDDSTNLYEDMDKDAPKESQPEVPALPSVVSQKSLIVSWKRDQLESADLTVGH